METCGFCGGFRLEPVGTAVVVPVGGSLGRGYLSRSITYREGGCRGWRGLGRRVVYLLDLVILGRESVLVQIISFILRKRFVGVIKIKGVWDVRAWIVKARIEMSK